MTTINVTETPVTVRVTDDVTQIKLAQPNSKSGTVMFVAASNAPDRHKRIADYVCDGTDDDVQIQAALDEIANSPSGGVLQLSKGTFTCGDTLTYNGPGLWIRGESMQTTQLRADDCDLLEIGAAGTQLATSQISDLTITESGGTSTTAVGIEFLSVITQGLFIERVRASGFGGGEFIINGVTNLTFVDNYISHNRASGTGSALKIVGQPAASWGVTTIKIYGNYFISTVAGADPMVYIEDVATGRFVGNIYENVPSGVVGLRIEATSGNTAQDCVFVGEHFESIDGTAWEMHDVTNVTVLNTRGANPAFTWSAVAANDQYHVNIGGFQSPDIIGLRRLLLGLTGPNDIDNTAAIQVGPIRGSTFAEAFMYKGDSATGQASLWTTYADDTGGTPRSLGGWGHILSAAHASQPSSRFVATASVSAGSAPATVLDLGANGAIVGAGSGAFQKVLFGSATWDPGSLDDGQTASTTVTVTGATQNSSMVFVGMNQISTGGWQLTGIVTSANTVTVTLTNHTGGTVDLGAGAVRVAVMLV